MGCENGMKHWAVFTFHRLETAEGEFPGHTDCLGVREGRVMAHLCLRSRFVVRVIGMTVSGG